MWAFILSFIWAMAGLFFYFWMTAGGILAGSPTDFVVRRCLFPFVFMFIGSILNYFDSPRTRIAAWFAKRPLLSGICVTLLIELFGLRRLMTAPGTTTAVSSAILQNWLSHWWIVLIALLLGVLGALSGTRLAQKWHKRSQRKADAS